MANNKNKNGSAAVKAGIGVFAALAATVAAVAAVTEYYIQKLIGIDYIDEDKDVYEDED